MNIPNHLKKVKDVNWTKERLEQFELDCIEWETGSVLESVHLSKNEEQLIEIFQYVHPQDYVYSTWRNHYHALAWYFKGMVDGRGKKRS